MKHYTKIILLAVIATFFAACGGGGGGGTPGTLQFNASSYSGDEDAGAITVSITRTGGSDGAVSADVSDTGSGTATSGTDYTAISTTTLSWANGDSSAKTFVVSVTPDGAFEPDETVALALGNATGGASLGTTSTTVTILNDDAAGPGKLQFDTSNYTVAEDGITATMTVTRTGGNTGAVAVDYATSDGSAVDGSDYTAASGTLNWTNGESSAKTFTVTITNDTAVESNETVFLTLSNPTGGASLGSRNTATLTIVSEDAYGVLQFKTSSFSVSEADGIVDMVITLQRVGGSSGVVSVEVTDLGTGSATGGGVDYTFNPDPATVTWPDGNTDDMPVSITLIDDDLSEGTKTVNLSLENAVDASIGAPATATVYIADDELPQVGELQFDAVAYSIGEDGGSATITVNRINGTSGAATVDYATSNGTATAGSDYTAASDTLEWVDGEGGAQTFTVAITNDSEVEGDETINLTLSSPTGAILGTPSTATLTINYNDTNLTMNIGVGSYWVAFQDGPSGSWTQWSPTSGNIYDFPVTDGSGRYGVAFHRQESDGTNTVQKTYVIHATVGELASLNAFRNAKYTVSGTLSNYTGSNDSAGALMHLSGSGDGADPFSYSIPFVSAGLRDFIAYEQVGGGAWPNNIFVQRNINVTGDLFGQDVNFGTDGETLTSTPHDFSGSAAGQLLEVYFATANDTSIKIASDTYDGTNAVIYSYITNASMTQTGDAYSFQVSNTSGTLYRIRNLTATSDPVDRSMGLGKLVALTGTAVNATQTTGLSYTPDPTSLNDKPVFRGFQIDLDQSVDGTAHWQIKISAGWLGSTTSYTHPALSTISGFNTNWDMSSLTSTNAIVSTATTQDKRGGLSLVTRKTMGRNSNNLAPDSWVIAKKLTHSDKLRMDIARQLSTFDW